MFYATKEQIVEWAKGEDPVFFCYRTEMIKRKTKNRGVEISKIDHGVVMIETSPDECRYIRGPCPISPTDPARSTIWGLSIPHGRTIPGEITELIRNAIGSVDLDHDSPIWARVVCVGI